ncbi:MAG: hypothetical protein WCO85_08325 [Actinomycetes bacterium]
MDIKIVVNSNRNFYQTSLPPLLRSLKEAGFDSEEIITFVGGCDTADKEISKNVFALPYDSIDFTSLIELSQNDYGAKHYFVMHDTSKVGVNFKKILYSVDPGDFEVIALKAWPSMNIGLYRNDYLHRKSEVLLPIRNYEITPEKLQESKIWGVENEDHLMWKQQDVEISSYSELLSCPRNGNADAGEPLDYYGNGTLRIITRYEFLDYYKIKANWERKERYVIEL